MTAVTRRSGSCSSARTTSPCSCSKARPCARRALARGDIRPCCHRSPQRVNLWADYQRSARIVAVVPRPSNVQSALAVSEFAPRPSRVVSLGIRLRLADRRPRFLPRYGPAFNADSTGRAVTEAPRCHTAARRAVVRLRGHVPKNEELRATLQAQLTRNAGLVRQCRISDNDPLPAGIRRCDRRSGRPAWLESQEAPAPSTHSWSKYPGLRCGGRPLATHARVGRTSDGFEDGEGTR